MSRTIVLAMPVALMALLALGAADASAAEKQLGLSGRMGSAMLVPVHHPGHHDRPSPNRGHAPPWDHHWYYRYPRGPIIVRPPVPGHPTIIYPFPGHPPVVHPPVYYYPWSGYHGRMDYYGRGFGFSVGW